MSRIWPIGRGLGCFARSHTHSIDEDQEQAYEKTYNIDGQWDTRDFSRFYNKVEDLYAFNYLTIRSNSGEIKDKERENIRSSFVSRFWRGGGSYVGFYDDLTATAANTNAVEIARVKYASPGEIVLRGDVPHFK